MKKYVIITNDRGTVVGATCYQLNDIGYFLGRNEHKIVKIPFTPKKNDRLHFNEKFVEKEQYENVLEYIEALEAQEELEKDLLDLLKKHNIL